MQLTPSYEEFAAKYEAGENQLVYSRLAADLDTPVSVMLKLSDAQKDSFILESVTGGEIRGRYSIIGLKPDLIWRCRGTASEINREARFDRNSFAPQDGNPLDGLRALIAECRIDMPADLPSAAAGLFGYLGYDMIRLVEHLPDINPDPIGVPDAVMIRPTVVAVLDGVKGEVTLVSPAWVNSGLSARAAYAQAAERVMDALRDLERPVSSTHRELSGAAHVGAPVSNFTKEGYLAAVEKAKDYIKAGDIFQVVPAQRWAQDFTLPPFAMYRALRRVNPSPFMFFFNYGDFQIIGASPEILVRLMDNEVTIRPIAGTRKRGANAEDDKALEADLCPIPKSWPSISCCWIWDGTTWAGLPKSAPYARPKNSLLSAIAMSCISSRMSWVSWIRHMMPWRRSWPACPPAHSLARPKFEPCKSLMSWSQKNAAFTVAAAGIFPPAATWTSALRCAQLCSRMASFIHRPAAALFMTATRRRNIKRR